jgi:hypothetical protein
MDMLDFSNFVEGHITGIAVNEKEKAVDIALRDNTGTMFVLKLEGIDRFVVNEMTEQNIVDRIVTWDQSNATSEYRRLLSILVSGKDEDEWQQKFSPIIDNFIGLIRSGERVLIYIEPVCGAIVTGLVRSVSLKQQPSD